MDYYRELNLNDPFRRRDRNQLTAKDDGDLFGLRPRARRLRVLLDVESLKTPMTYKENQAAETLTRLLKHELVRLWRIDMGKVNEPADDSQSVDGTVYLHSNNPGSIGPYGRPGPSYGLRVVDDANNGSYTSISPILEILKDIQDLSDRGPDVVGVTPDDVLRNVLLTQTARQTDMDIVVSQAITVGRTDIPSNYQANVLSPVQAIPIVAHYLRVQQVYLINPRGLSGTRRAFYQEAVCALAPRIWHWLAGCQYSLNPRYLNDAREMIGRLNRSLKAFDDLLFHLGSFPNPEIYDDIADCVDRVLVSLCGAVDVIARSLHSALSLPGKERNSKLHLESWYKENIQSVFTSANGIDQLNDAQAQLPSVFKLRNTIHSTALQATGASSEPASFVELDRGRISLVVPNEIYQDLSQDEQSAWGLEMVLNPTTGTRVAAADLAAVTETALNRVFRFLDRLCWVASFEQVSDRADFMDMNIVAAMSIIRPVEMLLIPKLLGLQSAAHDDETNAPYPLHPDLQQFYDQQRESDETYRATRTEQ